MAPLHPARMGLEPLALADWLKPQPGDDALLAERALLIAAHSDEVIAALPAAHAAVMELADTLRVRGVALEARTDSLRTLAAIGCAVAEDVCILTRESGAYLMTAGLLCFPNRWRLTEKIGHSVLAVHGPVPDYAETLTGSVDRFLAKLRPARAYVRSNWGLAAVPDLFLPVPTPPVNPRRDTDFYFRHEEQSFLKLPKTEAVIFGIRTRVTPWRDVAESTRSELLTTIDALSPAWLSYKSIG